MRLFNLKEDRLRYEFLPAAEEIVETPPSPFGRVVLWLITTLLLIALAWSYFGRIDIIAPASGRIVPEGSIKTIQPSSPGVVEEVFVSEGQKVKSGDMLIKLDSAVVESDVKATKEALTVAKLEKDILANTVEGLDVVANINSADIHEDLKMNLVSLAESVASANQVQYQILSSGVADGQQQVEVHRQGRQRVESSKSLLRAREQQVQSELDGANPLTETGVRSELRFIQQQIASLDASLGSYDLQIAQAQASVNEANERLDAYSAENKASAYTNILEVEKRITELESALKRAEQSVEQMSIKSPVDGTVLSLSTETIGGFVTAAQPIADIVPEGVNLYIDATVQNRDIGFIEVGQPVVVKVDTYSFQRYGYMTGRVKYISPDAIQDEKQGLVYKMKVEIDSRKTSKGNTIKVEPGMAVSAEITTGKRRLIEFFLDPLMTHVDSSLEVR